jgi:hypothetical protein
MVAHIPISAHLKFIDLNTNLMKIIDFVDLYQVHFIIVVYGTVLE